MRGWDVSSNEVPNPVEKETEHTRASRAGLLHPNVDVKGSRQRPPPNEPLTRFSSIGLQYQS